jgi:hypothetical protein
MFPFPICPLAGQSGLGQNISCGFIGFTPMVWFPQEFASEPRFFQALFTLLHGFLPCYRYAPIDEKIEIRSGQGGQDEQSNPGPICRLLDQFLRADNRNRFVKADEWRNQP